MSSSFYTYWFIEMADPRVYKWPLMQDPGWFIVISVIYLLIVKHFGPQFMKERQPFDLKFIIAFYDLTQVIFCTILFFKIITYIWLSNYKVFGCENVDYSDNPQAVNVAKLVWWTFMLKLYEYVETVFFVLRKKNQQVSLLHIYHHLTIACLTWIVTKYVPGGISVFPIALNCFVHMVMYIYYFLAVFGPNVQKQLNKWKSKITLMQMIQFCIAIAHTFYLFEDGCKLPKPIFFLYVPNIIAIFYMFYEFYITAYINKSHKS